MRKGCRGGACPGTVRGLQVQPEVEAQDVDVPVVMVVAGAHQQAVAGLDVRVGSRRGRRSAHRGAGQQQPECHGKCGQRGPVSGCAHR